VNGNVKLGRAAARSGEWAQHFSNASCFISEPDDDKTGRVAIAEEPCDEFCEI